MLSAHDLVVKRGRRIVVTGVNLALQPGTLTAICGPNGAGKSSLIAALAGLLLPAAGKVALEGESLRRMPHRHRARSLGFLPQQATAAWDIDVGTLVALGRLPWQSTPGRPARADRVKNEAAVAGAIAAMQLERLVDRPISALSGGERARAMMARVLAGEPRWILADEPLASLDLAHQKGLCARLRDQAARGKGVIVVMHDLALAMNHADRVVVMDDARIIADAEPGEALREEVIARVWGVKARWLGERGAMALSAVQ